IARTTTGTAALQYPTGLTWGSDGLLYVVDLLGSGGAGRILRYNPDGTFNSVFVTAVSVSPAPSAFPSDGLFTTDGRYLTANLGTQTNPAKLTGSVSQFDSTGAAITPTLTAGSFPNTGANAGSPPAPITNLGATQLTQNLGNHAPTASITGGP